MSYFVTARPGSDFAEGDRAAFIDLVRTGGEVFENTLRLNVPVAPCLAFLRDQERLLAVGALKTPLAAYRPGVRQKTGIDVDE